MNLVGKDSEPVPLDRAVRLIEEDIRTGFKPGSDRWDNRIFVSLPTGQDLTDQFGGHETVTGYWQPLHRFKFNALWQDARIQQFGSQVVSAAQINQAGE